MHDEHLFNDPEQMAGASYRRWKGWNKDNFGELKPGTEFQANQIFMSANTSDMQVLEIGFGNGELISYFRKQGLHVVGVELNHELVELAGAMGLEAHAGHVWNIKALKGRSFDLIIGFAVAEHLSELELNLLFKWCASHLNRDGQIVFKFPEGASPFALGYQNGDFTHKTCITKEKIKILCQEHGLKICTYYPEPLTSNQLCSKGLLGRAAMRGLQIYGNLISYILRIILLPLAPELTLAKNSIVKLALIQ